MVHNDGQRTKKEDPFQSKPPMDAFADNTVTIVFDSQHRGFGRGREQLLPDWYKTYRH